MEGKRVMFHLNISYVNQVDRERDIEEGLRRRRMLQADNSSLTPVDPPIRLQVAPRQVPIRPRAAAR